MGRLIRTFIRVFIRHLFYNHLFYGLCAVALMLETSVQLGLQVTDPYFYLTAFGSTVLFYQYPKWASKQRPMGFNAALQALTLWTLITLWGLTMLILRYFEALKTVPLSWWIIFTAVPLLGALYYRGPLWKNRFALRSVGWLKPLVIGLVWTGLVFVYPILFSGIQSLEQRTTEAHFLGVIGSDQYVFATLLFLKSVLFITLLAILFDAKDMMTDSIHGVQTFMVRMGLRQTLFYLVLPLSLLGLLIFLSYNVLQDMSAWRMLMVSLPFILLIPAIFSLRRERPLWYYLVVIDGLMLVKALCGIAAMQL